MIKVEGASRDFGKAKCQYPDRPLMNCDSSNSIGLFRFKFVKNNKTLVSPLHRVGSRLKICGINAGS